VERPETTHETTRNQNFSVEWMNVDTLVVKNNKKIALMNY